MSIHFLFTKSKKPGSKLIRWGLGHESSHFAVAFDLVGSRGVVFHSHFTGFKIAWAKDFLAGNEIVTRLDTITELQPAAEELLYDSATQDYGKSYDFGAFLYFAVRVLLKKICRVPMPDRNLWGSSTSFLCTEIAENMRYAVHDVFMVMLPYTKGMTAPDDIRDYLVQSPFLKRV